MSIEFEVSVAEHDTVSPKVASDPPSCGRCSTGGMEQLTVLPRLGDRPRFHVFQCIACGFVDWMPADWTPEVTQKPAS